MYVEGVLLIDTYKWPKNGDALGRIRLPNRMNFWKSAKGGEGVIFVNTAYTVDTVDIVDTVDTVKGVDTVESVTLLTLLTLFA